jgi:RNA polymerase sigma factor (sigma-70 family)
MDTITQAPRNAEELTAVKAPAGAKINGLYESYLANPGNAFVEEDFIKEIQNFANRIIWQQAGSKAQYLTQSATDRTSNEVVQDVAIKVLAGLEKFDHESKFSTWVYEIAKNTVIDAIRKLDRRADKVSLTGLQDVVGLDDSGSRKATVGAGPDELAGAESNAIIQKNVAESLEDGINADIDYERFFRKLPRLDQQILELTREGCQSDVIAKELRRDAHWVRNQQSRIREKMRSELGSGPESNPRVQMMLVHSCRIDVKPATETHVGELYIQDGNDYRQVAKCRCNKWIPKREVQARVESGLAQPVYRLKDGAIVATQEVWEDQATRVPRCGLNNSRSHLEKAYGIGAGGDRQIQSDIEFGHEITQGLRSLIAPFRPDPWEGRVCFVNFTEERTPGGYTRPVWWKPEEKPKPADRQTVILRKDAVCPNCRRPKMVISVYPDGCTKYDHGDCYLNVFRPPVSKAPVSNVLVLNREEHSTPVIAPAAAIPARLKLSVFPPAATHEGCRTNIIATLKQQFCGGINERSQRLRFFF